jgi:plastocyanin
MIIGACGRKDASGGGDSAPATSGAPASAPAGATPTGKIVTVELNSDAAGNYFKPADFEAHRGDVIRFTLKSGVHNVHFLADSNPGKNGLPAASDMLQLPDQTLDIPVNFEPGTYYFQCDPHIALGMKGHVKVER